MKSDLATAISSQQKRKQQRVRTAINSKSYKIHENVANDSTYAATATKATTTRTNKMTDERNNNNSYNNNSNHKSRKYYNNNTNNNINNDTNDNIIAEAAKIVLKNGLNGAATAATLLAAAAAAASAINLPPPPLQPPSSSTQSNSAPHYTVNTNAAAATTDAFSFSKANNGIPSEATVPLLSTATTTGAENATATQGMALAVTTHQLSAVPTRSTTNDEKLLFTSERILHLGAPTSSKLKAEDKIDNGQNAIDYTNFVGNNQHNNDIGRHPISTAKELPRGQNYGGRLQFFKDGKFILELARSKDGDKSGWVSVPRKIFRTPSSATSSTITPTSTTSTTYPKNESSTSLSFSDDNSSIQSSPWQRDHCWKQATPRFGISKEMSLFYQRPNQLMLTAIGLQASRKKRRRPFDNDTTPSWKNVFVPLTTTTNTADATANTSLRTNLPTEKDKSVASRSGDDGGEDGTDCIDGSSSMVKEQSSPPTSNSQTAEVKAVAVINEIAKSIEAKENMNTSENDNDHHQNNDDDDDDVGDDVTMKLVENVCEIEEKSRTELNGNVEQLKEAPSPIPPPPLPNLEKKIAQPVALVVAEATTREGSRRQSVSGEKRLRKLKTRAKLITIIQNLIDRIPTTVGLLYLSKTLQPMVSGISQNNSLSNKISTSFTTAVTSSPASVVSTSRLVELQHQQQHVSPRKRILREFEKVSLEDTNGIAAAATTVATTAVGAKRSRAKVVNSNTANVVRSSPQRVQSTNCAALASTLTTSTAGAGATITIGGNTNKVVAKAGGAASSSSTPSRLYSSYSIHALLGSGSGTASPSLSAPAAHSSSTASSAAAALTGKRLNEHIIMNNSKCQLQQHHQQQHSQQQHSQLSPQYQQHNFTDPSYLRSMLESPKSPESNCGGGGSGIGDSGKSPLISSNHRKRSPPYSAGDLYDNHGRSSNISAHASNDYARRSPRAAPSETSYKIRLTAEHNTIGESMSPSSHLHLQQQPQQQPQSFYSPYMMSPKYVPSPIPQMNASSNTARSPRHSATLNAHIPAHTNASSPASAAAVAVATAANCLTTRELSPPRAATAPPPPRDYTPRTVPKKTASIRRQFASPTNDAAVNSTNSAIAAKSGEQQQQQMIVGEPSPPPEHRIGLSATTLQQQNYKTASHINSHLVNAPPPTAQSPFYYMHPPNNAVPTSAVAAAQNSTNAAAAHAAAAAATAAAYIPAVMPPASFYNPYMSTIAALRHNPMWLHGYQGAVGAGGGGIVPQAIMHPSHLAAAASSSSRFPLPFYNFPYNGVGAAALAAAAAAAAAFGSASGGSGSGHFSSGAHFPHMSLAHQMSSHVTSPSATALHHSTAASAFVSSGASPHSSPHSTDDNSNLRAKPMSAATPVATTIATNNKQINATTTFYTNRVKDEHSSDVPLNLSKH